VRDTAAVLAQLRAQSLETLARATADNARRLFRIPPPNP
jgi:Tat protein secretion system quality control protein TatD with DNase activity